jgi:hypothetical protein
MKQGALESRMDWMRRILAALSAVALVQWGIEVGAVEGASAPPTPAIEIGTGPGEARAGFDLPPQPGGSGGFESRAGERRAAATKAAAIESTASSATR